MKSQPPKTGEPEWTEVELDRLVEEATVDCYNDAERVGGFHSLIDENLSLPFDTSIAGSDVTVEGIDLTRAGEIVATYRYGFGTKTIRLLDLPLPSPPPLGAQWIAAYRHWVGDE